MQIRTFTDGDEFDTDRSAAVIVFEGVSGAALVRAYSTHGNHPADPGVERWQKLYKNTEKAMAAASEWAVARGLNVITVVKECASV